MKSRFIVSLAMASALLAGMAPSIATAEDKPAFSGFLGDYSGFQESERVKGAWAYSKPGADIKILKNYNKIMLDPVQVHGGADDVFKDIDPAELQKAAESFHAMLASTIGSDYPVVTEPGADVLHMRAALTGSVPRDPKHGVTSYLPVMLVFRAGKAATHSATDKQEIQVEVTVEMEFLDSLSNERLFAAVDSHRGSKEAVPDADPDSRIAVICKSRVHG
jgi:hypothetical protein